jgi:hydroxysqualene dehydroxylase
VKRGEHPLHASAHHPPTRQKRVAVIGFGYAGASAALALAHAGVEVHAYEAARTLGGRARRVKIGAFEADNGQHIALGAYRVLLQAMRLAKIDPRQAFLRLPLQLAMVGGMQLLAPTWLPAPLHLGVALATARGLKWADRYAAARFFFVQRWHGFVLSDDTNVHALLAAHAQSATVIKNLWEPLCIAALNTPMEQASARIFLTILRDAFTRGRQDSDMLIPRVDLSALLPDAAALEVEARGGSVEIGHGVKELTTRDGHWLVDEVPTPYDAVIVATAPQHAAALLPQQVEADPLRAQLTALNYESITTVYLQYPPTVRLPKPMLGFIDSTSQWVFDRGQLAEGLRDATQPRVSSTKPSPHAGQLAVVISASARALELGKDELLKRIQAELAQAFNITVAPSATEIITEKRATFRAAPNLVRPANRTPLPGLWLAGDYVEGPYPATLEGAVRSGFATAKAIVETPRS